jgi:glycolate oxidase
MYGHVNGEIVRRLAEIVGPENVVADAEKMADYGHDECALSAELSRLPDAVVKPKSPEEVSEILNLANSQKLPVTPRGGATGLCGGCVPHLGGIVLSLEKMKRVIEIDRQNQMAVVEAGLTLMEFYRAVNEAGLAFPAHPGEESAMIGGLIATNAGGSRAVKYGTIRNYVRGLEVVLPTGEIIRPGGKLVKSSTGYNLLQLFIGSEGTLGIITRATLNLLPSFPVTRSLIVPFEDIETAIETVPALAGAKILPMAVEFIEREVIGISEQYLNKKWPCRAGTTYLLIILDASSEEEMDRLSQAVAEVCLDQGASDIYVADTAKKQEVVLEIRSKIYEAIKAQTIEILDLSVPKAEIARHVRRIHEVSRKYDIWLPTFGHAADGNVHTHIMKARLKEGRIIPLEEEEWRPKLELVRGELYQDGRARGGVISGEHGIGLVKKKYLSYFLDDKQVELMKGIKAVFDPNRILNPGKIFD